MLFSWVMLTTRKRDVENYFGVTSITSALCLLQFGIKGVETLVDFWDMSGQIQLTLVKGWKGVSYQKNLPCGRQYPSSDMKVCNCLKVVVNSFVHVISLMDRWDTFRLSPTMWWCNTISGPKHCIHCCSTEPFYFLRAIHLAVWEVYLVCRPAIVIANDL